MTQPIEDWDCDLTSLELARFGPSVSFERTTLSLTRKVELLERMQTDFKLFMQHQSGFPWSPAALRRWNDPDLGLWRWGDSNVEKHPTRQALMDRYSKAILKLVPFKELAKKYEEQDVERGDTLLIAQIDAKVRAEYGSVVSAKDIEISNLRKQVFELLEALRLANKKVGTTQFTSR